MDVTKESRLSAVVSTALGEQRDNLIELLRFLTHWESAALVHAEIEQTHRRQKWEASSLEEREGINLRYDRMVTALDLVKEMDCFHSPQHLDRLYNKKLVQGLIEICALTGAAMVYAPFYRCMASYDYLCLQEALQRLHDAITT